MRMAIRGATLSPTSRSATIERMRDTFEMASILRAYRDFSECVIDAITWADHGTTVAVTFDYPWKPDGGIRGDGEERLYVTLTFKHVQEFDMRNALRVMQGAGPSGGDGAGGGGGW